MPFLFVDYDQGAGGEYLSWVLSQAPQSVPLNHYKTKTNRYKVFDRFNQEFLKEIPSITAVESDTTKFEIVPTHRQVDFAKQILKDVRSIRIKTPNDLELWNYLKNNQMSKVMFTRAETNEFFVGEVKTLAQSTKNPNFLKQINHKMEAITLKMIALGIEPTDDNRKKFINDLYIKPLEPSTDYDLVIPYEKLILDPMWVQMQLKKVFNIDADLILLSAYKNNYENRKT